MTMTTYDAEEMEREARGGMFIATLMVLFMAVLTGIGLMAAFKGCRQGHNENGIKERMVYEHVRK